uniref:Uncharacterized protein n=1 Tax=Meloidogyne javanica TaxID=6303 RepID=A0A915LN35_MELJA
MYIQTTKGSEPEKVLEIQTMIQNKRRELASKGKYVQGKSNNCAVEETNFVDLQQSLIARQNTQLLDYLLTIEQHACRIRDSPVGIQDFHYNSSVNSLATLLSRKENLIAMKPEYVIGKQNFQEPVFNPNKGLFSSLPKPLTDLLFIIVDTARTMPFFDKLDLTDKKRYGPLAGAKRYAELLHLIEFCFTCGNNHSLLLNYMAYVTAPDHFHKSMPEAFVDLCLRCKT